MHEMTPELQPHQIAGVSPEQADEVVTRAFQNNALREIIDHENPTVARTATETFSANEERIGELAGQGSRPEPTPEPTPVAPTSSTPARVRRQKRVARVVDPASGRIVRYGHMRPGSHPQGGRIVQ